MAQERKKRRIVLASVLKPVDDTRMLEKMGASLAQNGDEVLIVGYPSVLTVVPDGIHFLPLTPFRRLSFNRLLAKWAVFRKIFKLKPAIVIFSTHELLLPCILLKIIMDVKIVYDVRENYYRNILHAGSFPFFIRLPLALAVRFKEKLLAPAVDHFLLAEKGYEKEFRFHRGGWTVVENKATELPAFTRTKLLHKTRLLFSGTLAESTGVFEAIALAKALHKIDPSIELTVIGYAALASVREKIESEVKSNSWITLIGGHTLVPHREIVNAIRNADCGILSYPPADHTINAHPTKLFEYLSACLPIMLENKWSWIEQFKADDPFIFTEFQNPDCLQILESLKSKSFYPHGVPAGVAWTEEAQKFLKTLEKL